MKITMQTLADELNVSRATVSYVLAGQSQLRKIPPETERRVLDAAKSRGFVANYWARVLAKQDRSGIGLLFPDATMSSTHEIVQGIQSVFNERGSDQPPIGSFLSLWFWNPQQERRELDSLLSKRVAGLICLPGFYNSRYYEKLKKQNFPVVAVTDRLPGETENYIMLDGKDAHQKIFRHLTSMGHKHIAVIGAPAKESVASADRYEGSRIELEKMGLDPAKWIVYSKTGQEETVFTAVDEALALRPAPTAIVASNDSVAYQIMHHLMYLGLTVGKDIALTGVGDFSPSRYQMCSMTTVQERRYDYGRLAAQILLDQIEGRSGPVPGIQMKGELVVRRSTSCRPASA